jgi:hypothetical protein
VVSVERAYKNATRQLNIAGAKGSILLRVKRENMSIKNAKLVFDDAYSDVFVRIWQCEDGMFLFQCLRSTGKDLSVMCPTLENAMALWENTKTRLNTKPSKDG